MPSYETAAFHAQQTAEKALKALLVHHQREILKTHDIGELLNLTDQVAPGAAAALSEAEVLSVRAISSRYPTSAPPTTKEVATRDLVLAARVLEYVRRLLGPTPGGRA